MIELYYVEDDADIAGVVKEYLERKNFKVVVYDTVSGVRKALEIHVPTVILLDWNMPDGRGDSLCQWICGRWKELPIIFLTVRGGSHDIVSEFENGADDYVIKPFELSVLYSRIQAVLRRTGNMAKQYLSCDGIMIDLNRRTVFCGAEEIEFVHECQNPSVRYFFQYRSHAQTDTVVSFTGSGCIMSSADFSRKSAGHSDQYGAYTYVEQFIGEQRGGQA